MKHEVKKTYRGWPGHFICAHDCMFRLNTLLEYKDKKIVVSTVGNYKNNLEEIGCDRVYETMVFNSDEADIIYNDADVCREIEVESKHSITPNEVLKNKNNIDCLANKMHEDVCNEIEKRLLDYEYTNCKK
jgi:hypothetical protein